MKKTIFVVFALACSFNALASTQPAAEATQPAASIDSATEVEQESAPEPAIPSLEDQLLYLASCTATVECLDESTISCSDSGSSASCSSEDPNCPDTRGSVTCGGLTRECLASCSPPLPPPCPPVPGCHYVFDFVEECCIDAASNCPDICA